MLELQFNIFQKKLKEDRTNGHFPTVHCMQGMDRFTFVMKSKEKWEYITYMNFEDILYFAQENEIDPNEAFDMFVINYCSNTLPIKLEEIPQYKTQNQDSEGEIEKIKPTKLPLSKQENNLITSGNDLIDEAESYSDFLHKFFNNLEKKVIQATNKIDLEKSINKTFGEFLRSVFNIVNTFAFAKQVKKYIKQDLLKGLLSSEAELKMDIGYTDAYEQKLNVLASQQIDGYMINGKKWFGIKGVTKEIQAKVIETVQSGVNENKSLIDIKGDIQKNFNNFSDWRAEMIARTETNRIVNEGKILGYKESGLEGHKIWDAAVDNRTSPICRRLDGQKQELDNPFIDPETRKAYQSPPSHPNCRSVVTFRPS